MPEEQVFISYSHRDKDWLERLQTHFKPYLRAGSIKSWSDQEITPSSQWFGEIKSALNDARVAVLLVTPDFLASDFIHEHELGPLLKEAEHGGVKILWLPIRDSGYMRTPLKNYQAVLSPDTPLAAMTKAKRDRAWVRICEEIEKTVSLSIGEAKAEATGAGKNIRNRTETVGVTRAVGEEGISTQVQGERDAEGFYTELGVKRLIDETSGSGEKSEGATLIYKTQKQRTWLVATYLMLYCIVDDLNRRKTGNLIQWSMLLYEARPIKITDSDMPNSGFLNIGQRKEWYYSKHLFPPMTFLDKQLIALS
jgi:hypothetical protein